MNANVKAASPAQDAASSGDSCADSLAANNTTGAGQGASHQQRVRNLLDDMSVSRGVQCGDSRRVRVERTIGDVHLWLIRDVDVFRVFVERPDDGGFAVHANGYAPCMRLLMRELRPEILAAHFDDRAGSEAWDTAMMEQRARDMVEDGTISAAEYARKVDALHPRNPAVALESFRRYSVLARNLYLAYVTSPPAFMAYAARADWCDGFCPLENCQ